MKVYLMANTPLFIGLQYDFAGLIFQYRWNSLKTDFRRKPILTKKYYGLKGLNFVWSGRKRILKLVFTY